MWMIRWSCTASQSQLEQMRRLSEPWGKKKQSHFTHISTSRLSHRRKQNKSSKKDDEETKHIVSSLSFKHMHTQAHTNISPCPLYEGVPQCFSVVTLSSAAFASWGKLRQWHFLSELFDSINTALVSLEVTLKHPLKKPKLHSLSCYHGLQLFCVGLEGFSESGGALFYFLKWFGSQWLKHKHTDTHRKASSSGEILMRRDLLLINCYLTSPSLNSVAKYSCISPSIVLTNRMSLLSCGAFSLSTKASVRLQM